MIEICIKRWIFNDSDEIKISRSPWSDGYLTKTVNSWNFWARWYFWVVFNNFWVIATSPKRYSQKFSKLNLGKIARRHLLRSQKYWNCKMFLCLILTTITTISCLCCIFGPLIVDVSKSYWQNGPNLSITLKNLH